MQNHKSKTHNRQAKLSREFKMKHRRKGGGRKKAVHPKYKGR